MITFTLFLIFTVGILFLMRLSPGGSVETDRFPFHKQEQAKAQGNVTDEALQFGKFCKKECRYRFICLQKKHALRDCTCREYELTTNALW